MNFDTQSTLMSATGPGAGRCFPELHGFDPFAGQEFASAAQQAEPFTTASNPRGEIHYQTRSLFCFW